MPPPLARDEEEMELDDHPDVLHLSIPSLLRSPDERFKQDIADRLMMLLVDQGVHPI